MIVVDASAMLPMLLRLAAASAFAPRLLDPTQTFHAPHLLDIEVAHVIRRFAMAGEIEATRGREALADLAAFPVRRHPHTLLLPRIWDLRDNLTACDATYVALAEALDAPLLTRDRRLARASGHTARIELV